MLVAFSNYSRSQEYASLFATLRIDRTAFRAESSVRSPDQSSLYFHSYDILGTSSSTSSDNSMNIAAVEGVRHRFPRVDVELLDAVWQSSKSWDCLFDMLGGLVQQHEVVILCSYDFSSHIALWHADASAFSTLVHESAQSSSGWTVTAAGTSAVAERAIAEANHLPPPQPHGSATQRSDANMRGNGMQEDWEIVREDLGRMAIDAEDDENNHYAYSPPPPARIDTAQHASPVSYKQKLMANKEQVEREREAQQANDRMLKLQMVSGKSKWAPKFSVEKVASVRADRAHSASDRMGWSPFDEEDDGNGCWDLIDAQAGMKAAAGASRHRAIHMLPPKILEKKNARIAAKSAGR
jgi:hypothetical protein